MATTKQIAGIFAACALSAGLGGAVSWRTHAAAEKQAWKTLLTDTVKPFVTQATAGAPAVERCLVDSLVDVAVDKVAADPRGVISLAAQMNLAGAAQVQIGGGLTPGNQKAVVDFIAPVTKDFEAKSKGCLDLAQNGEEKAAAEFSRNQILLPLWQAVLPGGPRF